MQKIKNSVLDKMLKAGLSRAEMDFMLYISHYQDDSGRIAGLHYKTVCRALNISNQTFYDVLRNLTSKGLILVNKEFYGDWDVKILGNSFEDTFEGYVSTGDDIFEMESFRKCKPQEKLLAMEFLKISKNPLNGGRYKIGKEKLIGKYCRLFQVTRRVLMRYLHHLKQFFSIGLTKGIFYIRPLKAVAEKIKGKTDTELLQEHTSMLVFRRLRVTGTEEEKRDASGLLTQYANIWKHEMLKVFNEAVSESIRRRNAGIKNKYKWNREINARFIHKIIQEKLQVQ